jgi:hypothetical protein
MTEAWKERAAIVAWLTQVEHEGPACGLVKRLADAVASGDHLHTPTE